MFENSTDWVAWDPDVDTWNPNWSPEVNDDHNDQDSGWGWDWSGDSYEDDGFYILVGIIAGAIVFTLLCCLGIGCCCFRKRRKAKLACNIFFYS